MSPARLARVAVAVAAALGGAHVDSTALATDLLPPPLAALFQAQGIPVETAAIIVAEGDSGATRLSLDPDSPRNPASTIKLLTTLAGLEILGPGYTWATDVYATGPVEKGRLSGDLVIKGHGDPYLVTESFWKLLRAVRDRGVARIEGDLVLDGSYFAPTSGRPGDFDGEPQRAYNALPDALALDFQTTTLELVADESAGQVRVIASPPQSNLRLDNRLRLVASPCNWRHWRPELALHHDGLQTVVTLSGDFSTHCELAALPRLLTPPGAHLYGVFDALWSEMGGSLGGRLRSGEVPADARLIYRAESRPLAELIRGMNKFSNNLMTRQLFLTLGAERLGPPANEEKARGAIAEWLVQRDLAMPGLMLENGAGLSRNTRLSAGELAALLGAGLRSEFAPEFLSSLPIAGVDGTMRKRLEGEALATRARIKTGSLDDVSAMAGYLRARSGRQYRVVMLINHPGIEAWRGKLVQDALLRWAYED
jgi:D-alanyl-D-alanine carboxypeptidase/D-alanyl-D-alanine-endopeptidase (penicillin-binding protein 4)